MVLEKNSALRRCHQMSGSAMDPATDELQCDQEKGQHGQKGKRELKPAAKSG